MSSLMAMNIPSTMEMGFPGCSIENFAQMKETKSKKIEVITSKTVYELASPSANLCVEAEACLLTSSALKETRNGALDFSTTEIMCSATYIKSKLSHSSVKKQQNFTIFVNLQWMES